MPPRLLLISSYANIDGYAMATPVLTRMRHLAEQGVELHLLHSGIGSRDCPYVTSQTVVPPRTPLGLRNALRRWRRSAQAPKAARLISHVLDPGLYALSRVEKATTLSLWASRAARVGEGIAAREGIEAVYSIGGVYDGLIAGHHLTRRTGLPWIAELLDPLLTTSLANSAHSAFTRGKYARIEQAILQDSDRLIVLTEGLRALLQALHSHPENVRAIRLGFEQELAGDPPLVEAPKLTFAHFGGLYRERTGMAFLTALKGFLKDNPAAADDIRVRQVGFVEPRIRAMQLAAGLGDVLSAEANIPHARALEEMARTPVLLLIQHESELSRVTVPLKFWEYLGSRRPIFALVDNDEMQRVLERLGGWCVPPNDVPATKTAIADCYRRFKSGELASHLPAADIAGFSARNSARVFLDTVQELLAERASARRAD